ncbi:MAG: hypothetical protein PHF84_02105, partial [bacterium]|nr:hypothetical protein [bacterium]
MVKKIILTVCLIFSCYLPLIAVKSGWELNKVLVKNDGSKPVICCNKNNVFVAYVKKVIDNSEIFFISSTNNGFTWSEEKQITRMPGSSEDPKIVFVDNKIYIVWSDFNDGNAEIYFTYSKDKNGSEFEPPQRVTFNPSDSIQPFLSSTGFKLILFWSDDRNGDYEIFTKMYDPLVNKWEEVDTQITRFSGGSFYPYSIAVMDEIHLVWQKKDGEVWRVLYSKSGNGKVWDKPVDVSEGLESAYDPRMVYYTDGLKVIFQAQKGTELNLYINTYDDMSSHWLIPMAITKDINIERDPHVIGTGNGLYAMWFDYSEGQNDIFSSFSTNEGLLWSDKANVSDTPDNSRNLDTSYDSVNDNIYTVWEEGETGGIMFTSKDKSCPTPLIISSSHSSNDWSYDKDIVFKWTIGEDISGIKDYAYLIDDRPDTEPDLFLAEYPVDTAKFYNVKDGIWYFHLRARDNMNNTSSV